MNKLEDLRWFDEGWAGKVRDATRELVRLYAEALEGVVALPKACQRVELYTVRSSNRPLVVVKAFLLDAVVDHIKTVLRHVMLLHLRAFSADRPLPSEVRLGVRESAGAEAVAEAEVRRADAIARRAPIAALLTEASRDVQAMLELLKAEERPGQKALKSIIGLVRRVLPLLWAGWVVIQFNRWSQRPQLQLLVIFTVTVAVYHIVAWLTLLFHDAGERKYIYFEGYMGTASDGLRALQPQASRLEKALFSLFESRPPVVISWETVVPILHYGIISILIVVMLFKLPLAPPARAVAVVGGVWLILTYVSRLASLWELLTLRYRGRLPIEIVGALVATFEGLKPLQEVTGANTEDQEDVRK